MENKGKQQRVREKKKWDEDENTWFKGSNHALDLNHWKIQIQINQLLNQPINNQLKKPRQNKA